MSVRERESLIARIRQMRRAGASHRPSASPTGSVESRLDALESRMAHLEQLVEGFQDSVHRESERQEKLIAELQAQIHPSAMSAALSEHARDRGL